MIRECHSPSPNKGDMTNDAVNKGLTDTNDLWYKQNPAGSFIKEVQKAVRMTHTEDSFHRIKQVKTNSHSFLHKNDWVGELNLKYGPWKQIIGLAISRALVRGI